MKVDITASSLTIIGFALSGFGSVSSFVPQSSQSVSPTIYYRTSNIAGRDQAQLHVASSELVGNEAEMKPRKTREVCCTLAFFVENHYAKSRCRFLDHGTIHSPC